MPQDDARPGPLSFEEINPRTVRELQERLRRETDTLRSDETMAVEFHAPGERA